MSLKKIISEAVKKHTIEQRYDDKQLMEMIKEEFKEYGKRFTVENDMFKLYHNDVLAAESYFAIEEPDYLFDQKYIGLYKFKTNEEFRGKGFGRYLMEQIFDYTKNVLDINYILLVVYKDNHPAINLYFTTGFEVLKSVDDDDEEEPYYILIKKI